MAWKPSILHAQARFDEDGNTAPIDQAIAAGLGLKGLRWNFLQTKTAAGDFSIYAPALVKMQAAGLKHTLTLFGAPYVGNPVVFADWAEQAMVWHTATFPSVLEAIEVWNEPNGTNWPIKDSDYIALIKEVDLRKRRHGSTNQIPLVGPVAGGGYMDRTIGMGLLSYVQCVSFHMYLDPEGMYLGALDHKAKLVAAGRPDLNLYISEWGAVKPSATTGSVERSLAILKATSCGASYFPLNDYQAFPDKGLLTAAGAPKATADAWKRFFVNIPETLSFQKRDPLTATSFSFLFKAGTTYMRSMWSTKAGGETVLVAGQPKPLTLQPAYVPGNVTVTIP